MNTKAIIIWLVFIILLVAVLMMVPMSRGFVSGIVGKVPVIGTYAQKVPVLQKPF